MVLQIGPHDFTFFSLDRHEPMHIHVKRDRLIAKFWLDPVELARNRGFSANEVNRIERLVHANRVLLMEAWRDYLGA